jgi:hypothetical protein
VRAIADVRGPSDDYGAKPANLYASRIADAVVTRRRCNLPLSELMRLPQGAGTRFRRRPIAIENARLFDEIKDKSRQLAEASEPPRISRP